MKEHKVEIGTTEAQTNLKIALKVQSLLEQSGATVILTRSDDNAIYDLDSTTLKQKKISDIKYYPNKYDEDRFVLYMNDSNKVYINLAKFKNINKYDEMVTKFEGKTGTLYLDSGNYFSIDKNQKTKKSS